MSRVTFLLAAAAATLSAAGSAQAGCNCAADYAVAPQAYVVQPPPVVVEVAPVVVEPVVPQYIVNQGPLYSGPMLTDYNPAVYYAPRLIGPYPYVGGYAYGYAPRRSYRGYPPIRRYY